MFVRKNNYCKLATRSRQAFLERRGDFLPKGKKGCGVRVVEKYSREFGFTKKGET